RSTARAMVARCGDRRVSVSRHRLLRFGIWNGLYRASRGVRSAARADRQIAEATDVLLRRDALRRRAIQAHVRRTPTRASGVGDDHDGHSQHANDRRELRLAHVDQLATYADDFLRAANRR